MKPGLYEVLESFGDEDLYGNYVTIDIGSVVLVHFETEYPVEGFWWYPPNDPKAALEYKAVTVDFCNKLIENVPIDCLKYFDSLSRKTCTDNTMDLK